MEITLLVHCKDQAIIFCKLFNYTFTQAAAVLPCFDPALYPLQSQIIFRWCLPPGSESALLSRQLENLPTGGRLFMGSEVAQGRN